MEFSGRRIYGAWKGFMDGLDRKIGFNRRDRAVLKALMALSAVDGQVGAEEIAFFRKAAEMCRGFSDASFEKLWNEALHSAGYLHLQANLLEPDELVQAFLREVEPMLVDELVLDPRKDRDQAFEFFEKMARMDGVYSDIEQACVKSLNERVVEAHRKAVAERYSRAAMYS